MSTDAAVREASQQFYSALNRMANGDAAPMAGIWSHTPEVTAMHPIGGRGVGWDAVDAAFSGVAQIATDGTIALRDQHINVVGDVACETGVEHGQCKLGGHDVTIEHRVTNIYHQTPGGWKMIHHHTDISPTMLEVLAQL